MGYVDCGFFRYGGVDCYCLCGGEGGGEEDGEEDGGAHLCCLSLRRKCAGGFGLVSWRELCASGGFRFFSSLMVAPQRVFLSFPSTPL